MAQCPSCAARNPEERMTCYACGAWLRSVRSPREALPEVVEPYEEEAEEEELAGAGSRWFTPSNEWAW
jgi:hypothetical protein